jgi:hypothetical protein
LGLRPRSAVAAPISATPASSSARADPVGQEAGRDLGRGRGEVEQRQQQPELRVANVELGLDQREQRRQSEQVEVAERVARADHSEHPGVASFRHDGLLILLRRNGVPPA